MLKPAKLDDDADDVHQRLLDGRCVEQHNKPSSIIDIAGDLDPHFLIRVLYRKGVLSWREEWWSCSL